MNLLTNWDPRSLITFSGIPCSTKTRSRYRVAIPFEVTVECVGRKKLFFVKRSTITKIVLNPLESGKGPIMSMDTICHGLSGTSFGCRGAFFVCRSGFTV